MLVSFNWLSEYIDLTDVSPEELAEKITKSGIEVESVRRLDQGIQGVVVGKVIEKEKHPNADKLNICLVDVGTGEHLQIICGAPNVAKGQKVAVAKVGATLPTDFKIKKSKLRGEESYGMICSLQELGIEGKLIPKEFSEGIYVFPDDVEIGQNAITSLGLDDVVFELGLTPNRSDCLSMIGVAYEVAAILNQKITIPSNKVEMTTESISDFIKIQIDNSDDCSVYIPNIIKNVKIAPSPIWLQSRLMASGIRPHNNVVDITNYIMLEYGQPLHAFDYDRSGKKVSVRRAKIGEKIVTLDKVERVLDSDNLVIANDEAPIAIAGVMGGEKTEVQQDTNTVLLEAAIFDNQVIRRSSKRLGLRSEASSRFEKSVNPQCMYDAVEKALHLFQICTGGDIVATQLERTIFDKTELSLSIHKVNRVLGTSLTIIDAEYILRRLAFEVQVVGDNLDVKVPTRRRDITIEEDLIEEIARLYGYDKLPTTLPLMTSKPGELTTYQKKRRIVRRYLEGIGLSQAVTYSLTNVDKAVQLALKVAQPIRLAMPMSEEQSYLRLSIVPHLLDVAKHNVARQEENNFLYETSSVFISNESSPHGLPDEKEHLAGVLSGLWEDHGWQGVKRPVNFFVCKGILEGLFRLLGLESQLEFVKGNMDGLHPGRTAFILLNGKCIGYMGQVHPKLQRELDLNETYCFEIDLQSLFNINPSPIQYKPLPRFPYVKRDIALIVDKSLSAQEIQRIIKEAGESLVVNVEIFDVYEGDRIDEGKKSVAFTVTYLDPESTLTDDRIKSVHEKIVNHIIIKTNAVLRS